MSEIRTIPEKILASGIKDTSIDAIGKFSKKVIHHNAGAPTAADDTGLGYAVGSIWVDSTNGDMYTAISVTAEDANWKNMDGDNVNDPFIIQGSNYGWIVGGSSNSTPSHNSIERYPFSAPSNSADVGEINHPGSTYAWLRGSVRNADYAFFWDGIQSSDNIWRMPFSSPATFTDVGEIIQTNPPGTAWDSSSGATSGVYGFRMGGKRGPGQAWTDMVQKITLDSPATCVDTGANLSEGRYSGHGLSDIVNGYMYAVKGSEAVTPSTPAYGLHVDTIEKGAFTISSGTFSDVGEGQAAMYSTQGSCSTTYGYTAGGFFHPPSIYADTIEKWPFTSDGNATDVGELLEGISSAFASSGTTHGWSSGGSKGPSDDGEVMSYAYASDGSASDQGEVAEPANQGAYTES